MLRHRRCRRIGHGKNAMWILVQVVRGSKYYEAQSRVGNRVMISDTSDIVIAGRALGTDGYRFEARNGNESFVVSDFPAIAPDMSLAAQFTALAKRMGAIEATGSA
jgi:hypothetical protein